MKDKMKSGKYVAPKMTKKELFKAINKANYDPIDWKIYRLPRKVAKYRLAFPKQSRTFAHVFKQFFTHGNIADSTLPYKTLNRLFCEVRDLGLPQNFILKSHPKIGYGVFTQDKLLKAKTVLGMYTGRLMLNRVKENAKNVSLYVYGIHETVRLSQHQYTTLIEEGYLSRSRKALNPYEEFEITVDAKKEGNWTRFINHSDKPNCSVELRKIQVSEKEHIVLPVIITKRNIKPHTQLTTDYGKDYWKACKIKKREVKASEFSDLDS